MLNMPARIILFFSSYVPLAIIFITLYFRKSWLVVAIATVLAAVGLFGLIWILLRAHADVAPTTAIVDGYRQRGDEVMGYVATYLIPFVGFTLTDLQQGIALLIFLIVLAYLYVTTDMIHINPTLYLFRYRVYEVTFEPSIVQTVIIQGAIQSGDHLHLVPLSRGLQIGRKEK